MFERENVHGEQASGTLPAAGVSIIALLRQATCTLFFSWATPIPYCVGSTAAARPLPWSAVPVIGFADEGLRTLMDLLLAPEHSFAVDDRRNGKRRLCLLK